MEKSDHRSSLTPADLFDRSRTEMYTLTDEIEELAWELGNSAKELRITAGKLLKHTLDAHAK